MRGVAQPYLGARAAKSPATRWPMGANPGDGTRLLTAENYALVKAIIDRHKEASNGIRLLVIQKRTAKAGVA